MTPVSVLVAIALLIVVIAVYGALGALMGLTVVTYPVPTAITAGTVGGSLLVGRLWRMYR